MWISYYVAVLVTWSSQFIPLVSIEGNQDYFPFRGTSRTETGKIYSADRSKGGIQKFGDFLADLAKETGNSNPHDLKESKKYLAALGPCRNNLLKCKYAGYWAYELTCWPLNQCGGTPEAKFLYYSNVNCMGLFNPGRGSGNGGLRAGQVKRNESDDPVLVVEMAREPRPDRRAADLAQKRFQPTTTKYSSPLGIPMDGPVDPLSSCRSGSRKKCTKACNQAYVTLCTQDYTCTQSVLDAFAANCKISCNYYFS